MLVDMDQNTLAPGFERVPCNFCGSPLAETYATTEDWLCGVPGRFTFVRCAQCGLLRQNPRPEPEAIGQFYTSNYKPFRDARGAQTQNRRSFRSWSLEYGLRRRVNIVAHYQSTGRLLDVGCATGLFLHAAQEYGKWQVQGIEPSAAEAEYGRRQFGVDIVTGRLSDIRYDNASFDVVTMWDVLEHLHDPMDALSEVERILRPGGIFVARVPHFESLDARLFGRYWAGLEPPRHLYVFPQKVLTAMLQRVGLVLEDRRCWGGYHMFALSLQFWFRARGKRSADNLRAQRVLLSMPVRILSYPYFALVDSVLGQGAAMAVIARKKEND